MRALKGYKYLFCKLVDGETFDAYNNETLGKNCDILWKNSCSTVHHNFISYTVRDHPVQNSLFLSQEKVAYVVQAPTSLVETDDEQNK